MLYLFQILPFCLMGITFYVAIDHFSLYYKLKTLHPVSLSFAVFSLSCGFLNLFSAGLYLAITPEEAGFWQTIQFGFIFTSLVTLVWFLQDYVSYTKKSGKYLCSIIFVGLVIIGWSNNDLLLDKTNYYFHIIEIIDGQEIGFFENGPGIIYSISTLLSIFTFVYLVGISINYYIQGHKKEGKPLLVSFIFLFIAAGNDALIYMGVYQSIYLSTYALIGMQVLMTITLSRILVNSMSKYRQLFEDATALSDLKTNLITFTSHELKTPLIPILGWAEFLKSGLKQGKDIKDLIGIEEIESIHTSAKRLTKIIEKFLDLGAFDAKKLKINKESSQILDIVNEAIRNLIMSAKSANIKILNNVQSSIVSCDRFRLEQVLINILSNAIKYSPNNTIVNVGSRIDNGRMSIWVQDQGLGFTPEQLMTLWRPQIRPTSTEKKEGKISTGIGLYFSKLIMEMHDGTIDVVSKGLNQGTTVTITLPI